MLSGKLPNMKRGRSADTEDSQPSPQSESRSSPDVQPKTELGKMCHCCMPESVVTEQSTLTSVRAAQLSRHSAGTHCSCRAIHPVHVYITMCQHTTTGMSCCRQSGRASIQACLSSKHHGYEFSLPGFSTQACTSPCWGPQPSHVPHPPGQTTQIRKPRC